MGFKTNKTTYLIINMMIQFFIETFVAMLIGYFGGRALDRWLFEDNPIFVYILIVLGIFSAFKNLLKRAMKISGGDTDGKEDKHH
jgi:F0F1-type ATP synthase assembly protein I